MNRKPNIYSRMVRCRVEARDFHRLQTLAQKTGKQPSILMRKALRDFLDREGATL